MCWRVLENVWTCSSAHVPWSQCLPVQPSSQQHSYLLSSNALQSPCRHGFEWHSSTAVTKTNMKLVCITWLASTGVKHVTVKTTSWIYMCRVLDTDAKLIAKFKATDWISAWTRGLTDFAQIARPALSADAPEVAITLVFTASLATRVVVARVHWSNKQTVYEYVQRTSTSYEYSKRT